MTTLKPFNTAATLKAERERDKAQAVREYEAEKRAGQANMMRLRALRLAKESADAQAAAARRPIKKKPAVAKVRPTPAHRVRRAAP